MWSVLAFEGSSGDSLGLLWEHLWHLGSLWGHFEVILGSVLDEFRVSLGSVWVSVGDFGSLDGHFATIVESLWVY